MKTFLKQTTLLTASNVLTRVTGVLFFIVLARLITVQEYGLFRYLIALAMVFSLIFTGIPTALSHYISKNKNNLKSTREYLSSGFVLMLILLLLVLGIVFFFFETPLLLSLFIFATFIDAIYLGFLRGILNFFKLAAFKLFENIIQLIILVLAIFLIHYSNMTFVVIVFSFSGLFALLVFEFFKFEFKFHLGVSKEKIKKILKYTVPVTLGAIGWTILFGTSTLIIKLFLGVDFVAYYSVGESISQVFNFVPAAMAAIILPQVAAAKSTKRMMGTVKYALILNFITSALILIVLLLFKEQIVFLLFTKIYAPALAVLLPLSIAQIFISSHQIMAAFFQGIGKPGIPSISIFVAAILNVVLSIILIKSYGIIGSAIAVLISCVVGFCVLFTIYLIYSRKLNTTIINTK